VRPDDDYIAGMKLLCAGGCDMVGRSGVDIDDFVKNVGVGGGLVLLRPGDENMKIAALPGLPGIVLIHVWMGNHDTIVQQVGTDVLAETRAVV
jgi:hypothetical protein